MTYQPHYQPQHGFMPQAGNKHACAVCGVGPRNDVHVQVARKAVTRKPLSAGQNLGHLFLDVITCGLWIPFHLLAARKGRREVTRYKY